MKPLKFEPPSISKYLGIYAYNYAGATIQYRIMFRLQLMKHGIYSATQRDYYKMEGL
jgi:hypothetical protein